MFHYFTNAVEPFQFTAFRDCCSALSLLLIQHLVPYVCLW